MSLSTRSTGFLESHLHWNDVEPILQNVFHTEATFGEQKSVSSLGEGSGFMSRICLVKPDWQSTTEGEELPETVIIKISSQLAMVDFAKQLGRDDEIQYILDGIEPRIKKNHNVETTIYSFMNQHPHPSIVTPKIYHLSSFNDSNPSKGFIIMEYLSNSQLYHVVDNMKTTQLSQLLRYLAAFQAMGEKLTEEEKRLLPTSILPNLLTQLMPKLLLLKNFELLKKVVDTETIEKIDELLGIIDNLTSDEMMNKLNCLSETLHMQPVLCHGDLWLPNCLWDGEQLKAVLDYQTCHFGNPAVDLTRMLCTCLSGKYRSENWREILKEFYGYLREEWIGTMPYTLDQLEESYLRYLPFAGFMLVPMYGPYFHFIAQHDRQRAEKKKEDFKEKTHQLIVDMLDCYRLKREI